MLGLISEHALGIVLGLLICLAVAVTLFLRVCGYVRELDSSYARKTQHYEERDLKRQEYCTELGHDLDASCTCRRCLTTQHDPEELSREEVWVEDVPGATWLDSNFQAEGHHEYQTEYQCRRCHLRWQVQDA